MILTATPAYGRNYKASFEAQADWDAGKDFLIWQGPYFSRRDITELQRQGYTSVRILCGNGVELSINLEEVQS